MAQTVGDHLLQRLRDWKVEQVFAEKVEKNVAGWWKTVDREAAVTADPVNPMAVVSELSRRIPDNAIVTADSGSSTNWYARNLRIRGEIRGSLSGTLATMGAGVPYAIGAKFAHPDRPVIALVGDGAVQMNGLTELITIARYRNLWPDPRCVICVFHNNDLNQVTWELRAMTGAPKFEESQSLPDVDYAGFARSLGLTTVTVGKPDQLAAAWETVLGADNPALLDVRCDPEVPPIPPHASFEQMKAATESVVKGDPNAIHLVVQGVKTKLQEFVPGRES